MMSKCQLVLHSICYTFDQEQPQKNQSEESTKEQEEREREPAIRATGPAFPPTLFDQLVQRVAAEVTRQLQPDLYSPAVQAPQVPSPAPAATPLDIIK